MSGAARLYTPELLTLAVELANVPPLDTASVRGEARSPTCGSTLAMDLELNDAGLIDRIGMRVRACAVGQASAAIFARHAVGHDLASITAIVDSMESWLASDAPQPEWPDLALIAPARAYAARHGAILLPWKAAIAALSTVPAAS